MCSQVLSRTHTETTIRLCRCQCIHIIYAIQTYYCNPVTMSICHYDTNVACLMHGSSSGNTNANCSRSTIFRRRMRHVCWQPCDVYLTYIPGTTQLRAGWWCYQWIKIKVSDTSTNRQSSSLIGNRIEENVRFIAINLNRNNLRWLSVWQIQTNIQIQQ